MRRLLTWLSPMLPLRLWVRVHRGCPYTRVTPVGGDANSYGYWCGTHGSGR